MAKQQTRPQTEPKLLSDLAPLSPVEAFGESRSLTPALSKGEGEKPGEGFNAEVTDILTTEEVEAIRKAGMEAIERNIRQAAIKKESDRLSREYFQRINGPRELWPVDLESMKAMLRDRATQYIRERTGKKEALFNSDTDKEAFQTLCLYFLNSTEFEGIKPGYSLKKGLLLNGVTGCGKTMLMRLLARNPKMSFVVVDARKLADQYSQAGTKVIEKYSSFLAPKTIHDAWEGQERIGLCIDDLGTENMASSYGNKRNVLGDILLGRYANVPFDQTFITTNFNEAEILKAYDQRLLSRVKEMFNVVVFKDRFDHRTGEKVEQI